MWIHGESVDAADRIVFLEAELAKCRARSKELADRYVGDLGQEFLKLGRENERLRDGLQKAVGIIRYGDELAAAELLEELLEEKGGVE